MERFGVIRYERLPFICFYYGHIGHTLKQSELALEDLNEEHRENLGYGISNRADIEKYILLSTFNLSIEIEWDKG